MPHFLAWVCHVAIYRDDIWTDGMVRGRDQESGAPLWKCSVGDACYLSKKSCSVGPWIHESGNQRKGQNWIYLGVINIWQVSKAMGLDEVTREKKSSEEQRILGKRNCCDRITGARDVRKA